MLQSEIYKILRSTGIEVFYHQTGESVSPPYIVYYLNGSEAYGSDFSNGIKKDSYVIEFYSSKKDAVNQGKIEKALDYNGIKYTTNESYLNTECLYMVAFYFEIVRKE